MEAHPGATEAHPGATEAHPGAVEVHPRAMAHPGSVEDHHGAMEARHTLIKMKKRNFFSEEFFTINKEIFPFCQGIIFLPYP